MSPEDIDALEAGPETYALVAKALGRELYLCGKCGEQYEDHWCPSYCNPLPLRPDYSTEWNGAMAAAEDAGLLDRWKLYRDGGQYVVAERDLGPKGRFVVFEGDEMRADTGPLAVCRALLRDVEMRRERSDE